MVKNEKKPISHLPLMETAFYCCLHGEGKGGVFRFSLGDEESTMASSVHRN
jgi:hypothetical protein